MITQPAFRTHAEYEEHMRDAIRYRAMRAAFIKDQNNKLTEQQFDEAADVCVRDET